MAHIKKLLIICAVLGLLAPALVAAAPPTPTITFDQPAAVNSVEDIVPITVRLSTDGLNLNALDLTIDYSTIGIEIVRVEKSLANFPLWPSEPSWDNTTGRLQMSAGRPNGVVAISASVATIYVKLHASGLWQLRLTDDSRGLLNDGLGTAILLSAQPLDVRAVEFSLFGIELSSATHPSPTTWYSLATMEVTWRVVPALKYSYSFSTDETVVPDNNPEATSGSENFPGIANGKWWFSIKSFDPDIGWSAVTRRAFLVDTKAPEQFSIIQLPPAQVGKKTVIAWSVVDADSGVISYELSANGKMVGAVTSPLVVRKEWAGKTLTIRAIDGAGNDTSAIWKDTRTAMWPSYWWWAVLLLIVAAGSGVVGVRRRNRRR